MAASRLSAVANSETASFNVTVPSGCRGIHIIVLSTATVTAVSVGGVSLAQVAGGAATGTSGELNGYRCDSWFVGSSLPAAGTRAVSITGPGFPVTLTEFIGADDDTEYLDVERIASDSVTDPSATLSLAGRTGICSIGLYSGQGAVTGITPFTSWTSEFELDQGALCSALYTYDTAGTSDVTAGWTQTADDALAICVAIAEIVGGGGAALSIAPIMQNYRNMGLLH